MFVCWDISWQSSQKTEHMPSPSRLIFATMTMSSGSYLSTTCFVWLDLVSPLFLLKWIDSCYNVFSVREDHNETCTSEMSTPGSESLSGPPYLTPTDHRTAKELVRVPNTPSYTWQSCWWPRRVFPQALIRDSYRCLRTGHVDYRSSDNMTAETAQKYNISVESTIFSSTSYFRILPPHIIWNVEMNDNDDKKVMPFSSFSAPVSNL